MKTANVFVHGQLAGQLEELELEQLEDELLELRELEDEKEELLEELELELIKEKPDK